jgi:hypothetical protein
MQFGHGREIAMTSQRSAGMREVKLRPRRYGA